MFLRSTRAWKSGIAAALGTTTATPEGSVAKLLGNFPPSTKK